MNSFRSAMDIVVFIGLLLLWLLFAGVMILKAMANDSGCGERLGGRRLGERSDFEREE